EGGGGSGVLQGVAVPGYPLFMFPDLAGPYLASGSLSPSTRTLLPMKFPLFDLGGGHGPMETHSESHSPPPTMGNKVMMSPLLTYGAEFTPNSSPPPDGKTVSVRGGYGGGDLSQFHHHHPLTSRPIAHTLRMGVQPAGSASLPSGYGWFPSPVPYHRHQLHQLSTGTGKRKKRKRERQHGEIADINAPKKCRARYGLDQQNNWCGPCRRKKRCVRYMAGGGGGGGGGSSRGGRGNANAAEDGRPLGSDYDDDDDDDDDDDEDDDDNDDDEEEEVDPGRAAPVTMRMMMMDGCNRSRQSQQSQQSQPMHRGSSRHPAVPQAGISQHAPGHVQAEVAGATQNALQQGRAFPLLPKME
ncbi:unnamed protein product, partial [Lampetra fluviatilis]